MTTSPTYRVSLRWLSPNEGGRDAPPPGPRYAVTARFAGDPVGDMFSVVFETRVGAANRSIHARAVEAKRVLDRVFKKFGGGARSAVAAIRLAQTVPATRSRIESWRMSLLVPENLPDQINRLKVGAKLFVHEGRRVVAECVVRAVTGKPGAAKVAPAGLQAAESR